MIRLAATIEKQNQAAKRLDLVAYSGGVIQVENFGNVVIDLAGLELPEKVTVLDAHRNENDAVLGAGRPEVRGGVLYVQVDLADAPASQRVLGLLASGVELQASVGVAPAETEKLAGGDTINANGRTIEAPPGGLTVVKRGALREVSVLPVGADSESTVHISAALAAERERVEQVLEATENFPALRARAISEGWSMTKTNDELKQARADQEGLQTLRASRPTPPPPVRSQPAPTPDVLASAVLLHAGYADVAESAYGARAAQRAEDLRARSLLDIAASAVAASGGLVPGDRNELIRAAFSTGSMPTALGSSAAKVALHAYRESPATWRRIAHVAQLKDFKAHSLIRPTFGGEFEQVTEAGELTHGTFAEDTYELKAKTFGKMLQVDRQAIINDDLGVFFGVAAALGRMGARAVADGVYQTLLSGLRPDGDDFWVADANSFSGSDTALGMSALITALGKMRSRTDSEGRNLDLAPRTLLVPGELEMAGRELLASTEIARYTSSSIDRVPTGNPVPRELELAVEPRLSNTRFGGASSDAWYLFAHPSDAALVVGFVGGREEPVVEQVDAGPNVLGVAFRGYIDFGTALADPAAATKMAGA